MSKNKRRQNGGNAHQRAMAQSAQRDNAPTSLGEEGGSGKRSIQSAAPRLSEYIWALLKTFGKQCAETWKRDICLNLLFALVIYANTENRDAAAWATFKTSIFSIWIVFALYSVLQVFRSIWILYRDSRKIPESLPTAYGIFGGLALLIIGCGMLYRPISSIVGTRLQHLGDPKEFTSISHNLPPQSLAAKDLSPHEFTTSRQTSVAKEIKLRNSAAPRPRQHPVSAPTTLENLAEAAKKGCSPGTQNTLIGVETNGLNAASVEDQNEHDCIVGVKNSGGGPGVLMRPPPDTVPPLQNLTDPKSPHKINFWVEKRTPATGPEITESNLRKKINQLFKNYYRQHLGTTDASFESVSAAFAFVNVELAAKGINARLRECPDTPVVFANVVRFTARDVKVTGCFNEAAILIQRPSN